MRNGKNSLRHAAGQVQHPQAEAYSAYRPDKGANKRFRLRISQKSSGILREKRGRRDY
jgi:hypothetical protein